jgi:signal transduction histidine kinase
MMTAKNLHFKTNVLLKSIIGKDLITDDYIAVLELVKNAFDAGSPGLELHFNNIEDNVDELDILLTNQIALLSRNKDDSDDKSIDRQAFIDEESALRARRLLIRKEGRLSNIIIKDTGAGMNADDLENKWLNIAYSEKKVQRERFGRTMAGNKGVGRFSCDRLGVYLDIYTRKEGAEIFKLTIDWRDFELEDQVDVEIQDILISIEEISDAGLFGELGMHLGNSGTIIKISNLRSRWTHHRIGELRKHLEKLINPNQVFESEKFKIDIIAPEYRRLDEKLRPGVRPANGSIVNHVFNDLGFRSTYIEAEISKDGATISTKLTDRNNVIFELVELNSEFPLLQGIRFVLYYLNPYAKAYFKRMTGLRSVDFGSIFLFINGFRIPPYGDQGNDWLGLERRKSQGYNRHIGTREVLGRIEVTDPSGKFQIISSRSGVVDNQYFLQLAGEDGYFGKVFRRLERYVVEGISWDSVPKEIAKNIENTIEIDPEWDEGKEIYVKSDIDRSRLILTKLSSILDIKSGDKVSLEIDKKFIGEVIEKEGVDARKKVADLLEKLHNPDIDPEEIRTSIESIAREATAVNALANSLRDSLVASVKIPSEMGELEKVRSELDQWVLEASKIYEENERIAEEKKRLEDRLHEEQERNTYLLATRKNLSGDAQDLVHSIKIISGRIKDIVLNIIANLEEGPVKAEKLQHKLLSIKVESDKILSMSRLVTRANFRKDLAKIPIDLVQYVCQYINSGDFLPNKKRIDFEFSGNDLVFLHTVSPLEIAVILDNVIDNSRKAGANKMQIDFHVSEDQNELQIQLSDNGCGVPDRFLERPEQIFQIGVTSTEGSGIGLASVKSLMSKMQGEVKFVGNGIVESGATFCLIFILHAAIKVTFLNRWNLRLSVA